MYNNSKTNLGKFDPRSDEGTFLGYAPVTHAFRVFNKRNMSVEESFYVGFYDTNSRMQEVDITDYETTPILNTESLTNMLDQATPEESATPKPELTIPAEKIGISII